MYEEDEVEIPIYLITGFLESGKTSFINFTVAQDYFQIDGPTLLITTEEGEVEYDEKELLKHNTVLEIVEGPEQFTLDYLKKLNRKYRPERIILEYNPLWSVKKLEEMELPRGWGIVQEIVTVDASCFQIYMQNMKSVFMEMAKNADMVMFNRCRPEDSNPGEPAGIPPETVPLPALQRRSPYIHILFASMPIQSQIKSSHHLPPVIYSS